MRLSPQYFIEQIWNKLINEEGSVKARLSSKLNTYNSVRLFSIFSSVGKDPVSMLSFKVLPSKIRSKNTKRNLVATVSIVYM